MGKTERLIIICIFIIINMPTVNALKKQAAIQPVVWHKTDTCILSPYFCDTVPQSERYTMMMVCQALRLDTAQQLWKISRADSVRYSVTTFGWGTGNQDNVKFANQNAAKDTYRTKMMKPCIYTMQHSFAQDTSYHDKYRLVTGSDNPSDSSMIILYESAYFDRRLNKSQALMFQTYLALKYGITLDNAHYLSTSGDTLWNAHTRRNYYNHIKGIASDTVYNLKTTHSTSIEDSLLQLSVTEELPAQTYVLTGDDNNALEWNEYNDSIVILQRSWLLRSNLNLPAVQISFNKSLLNDVSDSARLAFINNDHEIVNTYAPDSTSYTNHLCYTIPYPPQEALLTLVEPNYLTLQSKRSKTKQSIDEGELSEAVLSVSNTTDNYIVVSVSLPQPEDIIIVIQDPTGKIIHRQTFHNTSECRDNCLITYSGIYLVSAYTSTGRLSGTREFLIY